MTRDPFDEYRRYRVRERRNAILLAFLAWMIVSAAAIVLLWALWVLFQLFIAVAT